MRPVPRPGRGIALAPLTLIVVAGMGATLWWRLLTTLIGGLNIGGGIAPLVGPVVISGLLVCAVLAESAVHGRTSRWVGPWLLVAVAPVVVWIRLHEAALRKVT